MTRPFVVDITPLKRQPGTQRPFVASVVPDAELALVSAEICATRLDLALDLEIAGEELIAQGTITVGWNGPCRRCLDDQDGTTTIETREIFQHRPVEGETYLLDKDEVNLEPMIRETVLLHLPVAPLCGEDCAGPDPDRFPTSVEADPTGDETDASAPTDPRWAALSELTFDDD